MTKGRKTGGRTKGTPNKVPHVKKEYIAQMLGDYFESGLMAKDFISLEPRDRMQVSERLMKFLLPTMQATSVDLSVQTTGESLTDRLKQLSEESGEK